MSSTPCSTLSAFTSPYGGFTCEQWCTYQPEVESLSPLSPPYLDNTLSCRLYHARRARWTNDVDQCRLATPSSVYGGCVSPLVDQSSMIMGTSAMIDTYCDNHVHICGTRNINSTSDGYLYQSHAQCRSTVIESGMQVTGYGNIHLGNNVECRNTRIWDPAAYSTRCTDTGLVSQNLCVDVSCDRYCAITTSSSVCSSTWAESHHCHDYCTTWPTVGSGTVRTGDSLDCRIYYANQALTQPSVNCPIIYGPMDIGNTCGLPTDFYCDLMSARCGN
jgi:hypothetical protein